MKTTLGILSIMLLVSCQNKSEKKFDKLEKMNWLVGNWEQKLPDGTLKETWTKQNDSTFSGDSYFINTKDTVHFESIKLTQKDDELTYIATVIGQNNDEPVSFKLTSDADNTFAFENPTHDYPQKITYKKVNETSLIATISGKQQGKPTSESYPMTKK
ncbi:DUF6265 family protein [Flavobacterium sp. AS60]|uniref:DUF6265 family protein n=1 Tax=Flavobacterium anseongense TaxID=2910677 RepID=UPI001F394D42|nr:DUF6265 family protein [Flavobacterium sp. AS60]MCF6128753.1 DUF6265 family protein [Flavobacterium sp. AS60]